MMDKRKNDIRVLDSRQPIFIVQFRLGLALVDLGTVDTIPATSEIHINDPSA
jgi:hypothetical protein